METFTANADPVSAARGLDDLRTAQKLGQPTPSRLVTVTGPAEPASAAASAPLRIEGTVRFPSGRVRTEDVRGGRATAAGVVRFRGLIGGAAPSVLQVRLRGSAVAAGQPVVRVVVEPITLDPAVRPPARTWVDAVRRRRVTLTGRELLSRAIDLDLSYARARQYDMYLWSPDPVRSRTTYVFRTSAAPSAPELRPAESDGGRSALVFALVLSGLVMAAGALVVV